MSYNLDRDRGDDIIGVQEINCATSLARRHAALTVHEQIDLRALLEVAEITISLMHVIEHLIILLSTSLALAKRENDRPIISATSNALKVSLGLLEICNNELDMLVEAEIDICALLPEQGPPLILHPHRNRTIDSLQPNFAHNYTRFTKEQLRHLLKHLRLPDVVILPRRRYRFTGEEILIVCMARIATGDPWHRLIPINFGGGITRWTDAFKWFIDFVFTHFYHKISGKSLGMWRGQMSAFRRILHDKLTSPL